MTAENRLEFLKAVAEELRYSLDSERALHERLEQRATTVVNTTGGLVAAVGAVTALVPEGQRTVAFSAATLVPTVLALIFFLGAIVLAQSSNFLLPKTARKALENQEMHTILEHIAEKGPVDEAFTFLVENDRDLLRSYRHRTPRRLQFVNLASVSQMLAIAALTIAVATLLLQ